MCTTSEATRKEIRFGIKVDLNQSQEPCPGRDGQNLLYVFSCAYHCDRHLKKDALQGARIIVQKGEIRGCAEGAWHQGAGISTFSVTMVSVLTVVDDPDAMSATGSVPQRGKCWRWVGFLHHLAGFWSVCNPSGWCSVKEAVLTSV